MNIIITSEPHLGKTTVCEKLVNKLKANDIPIGGILCKGDEISDINGETHQFLYKEKIPDSQKVGLNYIKESSIRFGEDVIRNSVSSGAVTIIDEYGPLELRGLGFHNVTGESLTSQRCIILVRKIILDRFLERYKDYELKVFELTENNRNELHEEIFNFLQKIFK